MNLSRTLFRLLVILSLFNILLAACVTALETEQPPTLESTSTTLPSPAATRPTLQVTRPRSVTATPAARPTPTVRVTTANAVPIYTYTVINTYPHDSTAFTQGLVWGGNGMLYEGTGLNGSSSLRKVALETGEVVQLIELEPHYFGEGIALYDDKIIQLTWQSRIGFIYSRESLEPLQEFSYSTEGWGITYDGERLIMSDGTSTLYFWDPETLTQIGSLQVHDSRGPVFNLNELEYVQGEVYANVWKTDYIVRIDPSSGQVTGWIDLSGLLNQSTLQQPVDVLNGIAYDAAGGRLFVTGKLWPSLFEIKVELPSDNHMRSDSYPAPPPPGYP